MNEKIESFFVDYNNEFAEYIAGAIFKLRNKNPEYKSMLMKIEDILDKYPKLRKILEDYEEQEISTEECKALLEIQDIKQSIDMIEEQEIFYLGSKELYRYFQKIEILK